MSLTIPGFASDGGQDQVAYKYRLLSCPIKGCTSIIKAWDWNFQDVAERPWCIEKV
ncbi:hypothetical protein WE348_21180 (plasmid) [Alteromonas macleodii]|uniref:hypothetical protein n=1 Tax=Alteromonas macleodii TaxID=28108 RepID=UPI0030D53B12